MIQVPENFIVNKFFLFAGGPKHNKLQNVYNGSCPICREGKSWLKKKRCYYIPKKNIVCCHNCGWYGSPYNWIKEAGQYTNTELIKEVKEFDDSIVIEIRNPKKVKSQQTPAIPEDSINLFSNNETSFWKDSYIFQKANDLIKQRRLDRAINKPKALYLSLTDAVHKNRVTIPFYNTKGEIVFYQTRKILESDTRPKYLSKVGEEKSLFGIDNIKTDLDMIFVTEGPIDAFFIQNGVAVAGITQSKQLNLTQRQEDQFKELFLYKKIWVLDNQYLDVTSKNKTKALLEAGHNVFIWPDKNYKDLNDLCIDKNINEVDISFIVANTYTKLKGMIKLSKV